jgi:hypothetical protein
MRKQAAKSEWLKINEGRQRSTRTPRQRPPRGAPMAVASRRGLHGSGGMRQGMHRGAANAEALYKMRGVFNAR